jgi:hypothetical protein
MRTIDLDLGDERRSRRVQLASAACGLSSAEFIRASVDAAIATMAEYDKYFALMLRYSDENAAKPKARAKPRAEAISHP